MDNNLKKKMSESKAPNVVGINVLKQNGLDVDELVKELIKNAAVEFTAYYYFTNLRAHCTGYGRGRIKRNYRRCKIRRS